jgi:DNA adenine methylase
MKHRPFLRWAGGKRRLARQAASLVAKRLSPGNTYIEPFLGSGAMYFAIAPKKAVLGDINHELIETFGVLRDKPTELIKALRDLPATKETYYRVRSEIRASAVKRAVRFIYLNRTCYGGLHRTNRNGHFNVPFNGGDRSAKTILANGVLTGAAECLRNTDLTLVAGDFESSIRYADAGDVIYCDPTYRAVSRTCYDRYGPTIYSWKDHVRLSKLLEQAYLKGALVILSTQSEEGLKDLTSVGLVLNVRRMHGLRHSAAKISRKELLFVLDPLQDWPYWRELGERVSLHHRGRRRSRALIEAG